MALFALLAGAPLLAACDPPPPPPVLTVDSGAVTGDADPGDGACDDGSGACTLPAAVQEANALGSAEIVVPDDLSIANSDLEVTASVRILGLPGEGVEGIELGGTGFIVRPGAVLALSGVDVELGILVQGTLVADRLAFRALVVDEGGVALLRNAFGLTTSWVPLVVNEGILSVQSSTLISYLDGGPVVDTAAGADTRLRSTAILSDLSDQPACTGATPTSEGYNAATDATCGLTATGDLPSQGSLADYDFYPDPGSVLHDAVPVGAAGCGTEVDHDILGNPRPVQGAAPEPRCDIGAWESQPFSPG